MKRCTICTREHHRKDGRCSECSRARKRGELYGRAIEWGMRAATGLRACTHCGAMKDVDAFKWQKRKLGRHRTSWCRACLNERANESMKVLWHSPERRALRGLQRGMRWLCRPKPLTPNERAANWRNANRERYREITRSFWRTPKGKAWIRNNRDKLSAARKRFARTPHGREAIRLQAQKRRVLIARAVCTLTRAEWEAIVERHRHCCAYCGKKLVGADLTMDHVVPISKGGHHTAANVVPACGSCNSRKHALGLEDFLARLRSS